MGDWAGTTGKSEAKGAENSIEPLKMSVYCRPVTKGVEDTKRSCFGC